MPDVTLGQPQPHHDATPPGCGWVKCLCGCGGLVRDGGPEEESAWARVFAERGIVDPTAFVPDEAYWFSILTSPEEIPS